MLSWQKDGGETMMRILAAIAFAISICWLCSCGGGGGGPSENQPPQIEDISLTFSGGQVTIRVKVTDAGSGVQKVTAKVSYPNGIQAKYDLKQEGETNVWTTTFTAQQDAFQVLVVARDKAGNEAVAQWSQIQMPPPPPF